MKEKIAIIGAGGHGKVCAESARLNGYTEIVFWDDNPNAAGICGTTKDLPKYVGAYDTFIAVGAHLAEAVTVGDQTQIAAGATIINNLRICQNGIIGAGATVITDISETGAYIGVPARKIK